MKIKILIVFLIISTGIATSQKYMDEIVLKVCECLSAMPEDMDPEKYNFELGICMINAAIPYKKQLLKDHKIDMNKMDLYGAELGKLIGVKMASVCPQALMKLVEKTNENKSDNKSDLTIQGQVTAISDDKFVEFTIRDESGKTSKYLWLTVIESTADLSAEYKSLINQFVQLSIISQEIFDPRIGEYRRFNVIRKLEMVDK
jgi:hypothetical protein